MVALRIDSNCKSELLMAKINRASIFVNSDLVMLRQILRHSTAICEMTCAMACSRSSNFVSFDHAKNNTDIVEFASLSC